jgi:transposase
VAAPAGIRWSDRRHLGRWGRGELDRRRVFIGPDGCWNNLVRIQDGDEKMLDTSMIAAGIDVSKEKLDIALHPGGQHLMVSYDAKGLMELSRFLAAHGVKRVGFESSGGYEGRLLAHLRGGPIEVGRFHAGQVKAFARSRLNRAKNDRRDALMIAAFTASLERLPPLPDAAFDGFAEALTYIEQLEERLVGVKTTLETTRDARLRAIHKRDIASLEARRANEIARLTAQIRTNDALARRLDLIDSVKGVGLRTALAILVRLPELGSMSREEAAAMAGLAPYDNDSGKMAGKRRVAGGRSRLRKSLYMAAFSATQWNPDIKTFYTRLRKAGKEHLVAIIASARKLIVTVNAIVKKGTPWTMKPAQI